MSGLPALVAGACLSLGWPGGGPQAVPAARIVQRIDVAGARELGEDFVREAARVADGDAIPDTPDALADIANRVERRYRDEGFTFATASASYDAGTLTLTIDEGVIDAVEFTGVDRKLAERFADEFALRAGDVFNRRRARQALEVLLRPTRGAIRPARVREPSAVAADARTGPARRGAFALVQRDGQRILVVGLTEPGGRFKIVPDLGEREDWFSPVDGFVPSLGFGAAVFDHDTFNHAYVAGHLSYKMAAGRAGYALGFERPLFGGRKLYVGGELHDLTASDDQWQVSSLEASLAAVGPRRSFRDYYRRRGIQIDSAFRPHPQIEVLVAWRAEREEPLAVTSDFSFWNDDRAFRANRAAVDGRLNALIVGASIDGRGFDRESLEATYRRHQVDTFFGERLERDESSDADASWRLDWTSEVSTPGVLDSDFDFRRHVVSARYRVQLSPMQEFGARAIGGWSDGTLPPQRLFAIGGIGSVHGYDFKEAVGTSMALANLEYALGPSGFRAIGFFDAGRVNPDARWLKGVGFGFATGDLRIDFGYKTDAVPSSLQVLLRFSRTF
jgi:surface antigen Omp85-like protein